MVEYDSKRQRIKRKWTFLLIVPLISIAFLIQSYQGSRRKQLHSFKTEEIGNPYALPCSQSGELSLSFTSEIRLNKAFLPNNPTDGEINSIIRRQIRFLMGFLSVNQRMNKDQRFFLSSQPAQIRIIDKTTGRYGLNLTIDPVLEDHRTLYVENAIKNGLTHSGDEALVVRYEAIVSALYCGKGRSLHEEILTLDLPYDPDLAFWLVPQSERRRIRWNQIQSITTPCGSSEMADLKVPSFYWYSWDPEARGKDSDGHTFDCSKLLDATSAFGSVKAKVNFIQKGEDFRLGEGLKAINSLTGTIFFGLLSPWTIKFKADELGNRLFLRSGKLVWENARLLFATLSKEKTRDPGILSFLYFLTNLHQVLSSVEASGRVVKNHLELHVQGQLKRSQRKISLRLYMGGTDAGSKIVPEHWSILLNALGEDDIIFYLGHSGMGANFSINTLKEQVHVGDAILKRQAAKKGRQLFSILGCDAYSYFENDISRLRDAPGLETDILTMANTSLRPLFHIGLLDYLDRVFTGEYPKLNDVLGIQLSPLDVIVARRITRVP